MTNHLTDHASEQLVNSLPSDWIN